MVISAALIGLGAVIVSVTKSSSQSSTKYLLDTDRNLITNELVGVLSSPAKCLAVLGGKNALSTAAGVMQSIDSQYYVSTNGAAPGAGYGNSRVKVSSYTIDSNAADLLANIAFLSINFENKPILPGGPIVTNKIKLFVTVDALNLIVSCHSISAGTSDIWLRGSGTDIYYVGNVGIGSANAPTDKLTVTGGSIVSSAGSSNAQCVNFTTGNVQMTSYGATNLIRLGGLADGGAYSLILTAFTAGQIVTVTGFTDPGCTTAVAQGVDFGGSSTAITPTFTAVGNTQVLTFIYSAARGVVYASPSTNFFR